VIGVSAIKHVVKNFGDWSLGDWVGGLAKFPTRGKREEG